MNFYFVRDHEGKIQKVGAIGFTPQNVIAQVPPDADPETWDIEEIVEGDSKTIAVKPNPEKIVAKEQLIESKRIEQEAKENSKKSKKEALIESLKAAKPTGTTKNLVDLILMDYE
jgi:hypothetical protein